MIVKVGFVVVKYLVLMCLVGGKIRVGLIEVEEKIIWSFSCLLE